MCQTLHEASRMQQQQRESSLADGDLGAIVRSAKVTTRVPTPPPPQQLHEQVHHHHQEMVSPPSGTIGGFMELISNTSSSSSAAPVMDFRGPFMDLPVVVKREPGADGIPELMQEIFSHSRAMPSSYMDDMKDVGLGGFGGGSFIHDLHHRQQQQQQQPQQQHSSDIVSLGRPELLQPKDEIKVETSSTTHLNTNNCSKSKRSRKMQQKRIVCVPVSGGGKPTGEVLPSDMWAWRKYGQKPIKGSPYPRGYYRCSSSKGCSARKQVERSRTDPTMLVITYTSEHNHPWPAHRNSLAGTTRTRPAVAASAAGGGGGGGASAELPSSTAEPQQQQQRNPFESIVNDPMQPQQQQQHQQMQVLDRDHDDDAGGAYTPLLLPRSEMASSMMIDNASRSSSQDEDFFSELEELPELSTILDKHFLAAPPDGGGGPSEGGAPETARPTAAVDPFSLISWSQQRPPK